jgi:hypothetical protein
VDVLREYILAVQADLFLVGYQDHSNGGYVPLFPEDGSFTELWTQWRSLLPQYAPPEEYIPPLPGREGPGTRGDMFRALDSLTRRLEELFGPDPEPRDYVSALPAGGEPDNLKAESHEPETAVGQRPPAYPEPSPQNVTRTTPRPSATGQVPAGGGDDGRGRADTTSLDTDGIDERECQVLAAYRDRSPVLVKNVDIEAATNLSKQTVGEVVSRLIEKGFVCRPRGGRKGATLTSAGVALVDRIRKSSVDHP